MAGFVGSVLFQVVHDLHLRIRDNHSYVVGVSIAPYVAQRGSRQERASTCPTSGVQIHHIGTGVNLIISLDAKRPTGMKWRTRKILKLLLLIHCGPRGPYMIHIPLTGFIVRMCRSTVCPPWSSALSYHQYHSLEARTCALFLP